MYLLILISHYRTENQYFAFPYLIPSELTENINMKLTTASIVIAAAIGLRTNNGVTGASIVDRHVKSMTAPRLFPGAQYGIDVDASEKSLSEMATTRTDRSFGTAWLRDSFVREMREFAGVYSPDRDYFSSGDVLHKMRMTHIVKTSPLHTDVMVGSVGDRASVGSSQGFYVLNDNPHAYFEMNDDELCIPIITGTFIIFNGRKPHRTVIADGSVDLLGPFDLRSLKCVAFTQGGDLPSFQWAFSSGIGSVTGTKDSGGGRQLDEETTDPEKPILGHAYRGLQLDDKSYEIIGHHVAYNVTGLPPCSNCNMSIAFSTSQECTKEAHDEATMIPHLNDFTYSADDEGNTGVKHKNFIVDSEHPVGKQFLAFEKNVFEDPAQVQESTFSVFFYDTEGEELVACSFLQAILSDEEKELAAEIFAIIHPNLENVADSISPEIEEDKVNSTPGEGGNNAGSLMFSFLPIVVSMAACVFFYA